MLLVSQSCSLFSSFSLRWTSWSLPPMCVVQRSEIWAKFVDTIWVSPLWLSPFLVISLQFPTVVVAPNFVLWFLMQRKTRFLSKFWLSCVYKSLQNGKLFQWHFFLSDIHSLPNLSLVTLSVFREFFFFFNNFSSVHNCWLWEV